MTYVSAAVEGQIDEAVIRRLIGDAGAQRRRYTLKAGAGRSWPSYRGTTTPRDWGRGWFFAISIKTSARRSSWQRICSHPAI